MKCQINLHFRDAAFNSRVAGIYGSLVRFSYEIRECGYKFNKVYLNSKIFARFTVTSSFPLVKQLHGIGQEAVRATLEGASPARRMASTLPLKRLRRYAQAAPHRRMPREMICRIGHAVPSPRQKSEKQNRTFRCVIIKSVSSILKPQVIDPQHGVRATGEIIPQHARST